MNRDDVTGITTVHSLLAALITLQTAYGRISTVDEQRGVLVNNG